MSDPFAALGLRAGASAEQVKAAFRAAALRDHPDRLAPSAGARERAASAERFKAATEAYELLCDERRRSAYEAAARYGGHGGGGSGGSAGGYRPPTVNTDWSRAGAGFRGGGGGGGGGSSRASPWTRLRRSLATQAFSVGLGVLLLGAAVAGLQIDQIWEARNKTRSFQSMIAARDARRAAASQGNGGGGSVE
jgi:curved DNA-binding protein CbpA